jgi:two-component system chemotaxis sensor kinase CheA
VLPLEHVHSTRVLSPEDIIPVAGRLSIVIDQKPIPVVKLGDLLELPGNTGESVSTGSDGKQLLCVIVAAGKELLALIVDELLDEQEVILQPLGGLLVRVRNVSGSAILVTGAVSIVLNATDLIRSAAKRAFQFVSAPVPEKEPAKPKILLVEDSITTRTWEKRGLEGAGFEVVTAVDGIEALEKLREHTFDAVVSDVEMPGMDGLTLTGRIRQDKKNAELPVVLVSSLANDEDKKRGIEAGANAYITKPAFDPKLLVETLRRLI